MNKFILPNVHNVKTIFKYTITIIILSILVCGCYFDNKKNKNTVSLDFKYKKGDNLNPSDWKCYAIHDLRFCIPSTWSQISNHKAFFFSNINSKDPNTFFVILKYSKDTIDMFEYLKETNIQLNSDTNELFKGYTAKSLQFQSKRTYYCEYFTKKSNAEYITYSSIFEHHNNIYEVALKTKNKNTTHLQEVYKNILFNIKFNEVSYFSPDDELLSIEEVDFSKL